MKGLILLVGLVFLVGCSGVSERVGKAWDELTKPADIELVDKDKDKEKE